ncbi:hypothetical protein EVAR_33390_1 [Eumeta japonica]|uniref:Uncharacterized protein n=1 Tax=Eumeta variegata TaxID=151549 RepID=A0A4C1X4B7_EUMVA|nr:hypothetical protein EVAR_33390_1 [Eumeta japonica]
MFTWDKPPDFKDPISIKRSYEELSSCVQLSIKFKASSNNGSVNVGDVARVEPIIAGEKRLTGRRSVGRPATRWTGAGRQSIWWRYGGVWPPPVTDGR